MLKIWSLKEKERQQEQSNSPGSGSSGPNSPASSSATTPTYTGSPRVTAAQLRVQKDLTELELPKTIKTSSIDPQDMMHFEIEICPDDGIYKRARIRFAFTIPPSFPHDPPKVKCLEKIYHPNIDLEGNVCLNILREDWKPVLSLGAVMIGLQYLLLEPNPADPLNKDAASVLQRDPEVFAELAHRAILGGVVYGERFDRILR